MLQAFLHAYYVSTVLTLGAAVPPLIVFWVGRALYRAGYGKKNLWLLKAGMVTLASLMWIIPAHTIPVYIQSFQADQRVKQRIASGEAPESCHTAVKNGSVADIREKGTKLETSEMWPNTPGMFYKIQETSDPALAGSLSIQTCQWKTDSLTMSPAPQRVTVDVYLATN